MRVLTWIVVIIVFALVGGVTALQYEVGVKSPRAAPSVEALRADKDEYNGMLLALDGYLVRGEGRARFLLYGTEEEALAANVANAIVISIDPIYPERCLNSTVYISGVFRFSSEDQDYALEDIDFLLRTQKGIDSYREDSLCYPIYEFDDADTKVETD